MTFRHNIVQQDTFPASNIETFLEQTEILAVYGHRLIRQNMNTGHKCLFDILSLLPIVSGCNHYIPLLFRKHLFQEIRPQINNFFPFGRRVSPCIIAIDLIQMFLHIVPFRSIHIYFVRHLLIRVLLYKSCMEMTGIERNQLYLSRSPGQFARLFFLCQTGRHQQERCHRKNQILLHLITHLIYFIRILD